MEAAFSIDRANRERLARIVEQFRDRKTSADECEDAYRALGRSADVAIKEIFMLGIWTLYSDDAVAALDLDARQKRNVERIILFLRSGLDYRWPRHQMTGLLKSGGQLLLFLASLGYSKRPQAIELPSDFFAAGDFDVWPFLTLTDYRATQSEADRGSR